MKPRYKKQGAYLSCLRNGKGISQKDFAGKIGVTVWALKCWENGWSFPDDDSLARIAGELSVPLFSLLTGEIIPKSDEEAAIRAVFRERAEISRNRNILKNLLMASVIALNILLLYITISGFQPSDRSLRGLSVNWNVEIPRGLVQEFAKGDRSLNGDGVSYHVYDDDGRGKFNYSFEEGPNQEAENLAVSFLKELSVSEENFPDFSHHYLWQIIEKNGGRDQMVCFFDNETQQYYFIERFT